MKKILGSLLFLLVWQILIAQLPKVERPPMGFMTWNYFGVDINENNLKAVADALVSTGLKDLGYNYVFIDDGWQGGRDSKNRMIPDPKKFPSGIKALADYIHSKGLKIGIYSDAAPLTCAGYTASLGFEELDAKTFAEWGIDYLKYDYCHAPTDWKTAIERYEKMAHALQKSGREIVFSICEWGDREPWYWAKKAGGQLWRTTADIRDKWESLEKPKNNQDLHRTGAGILDILNINAELDHFAKKGAYNDPDMLIVGLYGKKGPSGELGGVGCTDIEYQSQMSLWCLMAAPLMISLDIENMNDATKKILMNKEIIEINQDALNIQAKRVINDGIWQVFVKPLENGDVAVGILNTSNKTQTADFSLDDIKIFGKTNAKDIWSGKITKLKGSISTKVASHETKVYRLSK